MNPARVLVADDHRPTREDIRAAVEADPRFTVVALAGDAAEAVQAALRDGAPRVEVAYCFLEQPGEPVIAEYTAADEPALTERLAGLAEDLLAGRYPVTPTPHRELCADCPGRSALCSWPEEMTLRDLSAEPRTA